MDGREHRFPGIGTRLHVADENRARRRPRFPYAPDRWTPRTRIPRRPG
jgi:hypothetical protein